MPSTYSCNHSTAKHRTDWNSNRYFKDYLSIMGEGRALCGLVVFVGFVSLAALAVALAALLIPMMDDNDNDDTSMPSTSSSSSSSSSSSDVTYVIHAGDDWGPYEFRNEDGYVEGFSFDMIYAVCDAADIQCRAVVAPYTSAWGADNYGGQGLFGGWYDASLGWYTTPERLSAFDFTDPYLQNSEVFFFIKIGASFDTSDLSGKKIGFLLSWAASATCVSRLADIANNDLDEDTQITYFDSSEDWKDAILNDEVDAGFCDIETMLSYVDTGVLDTVGSAFYCSLTGSALMLNKNRQDLLQAWNYGFKLLQESGQYDTLCEEANTKYADRGVVYCL